ncbi:MAG: endonuclease/exonuclease/phosphatase family protein [Thermoanaerobaculales bacterium]|nr:endonuclease/exonuclease/phosphatase family protein [Thermoanaerobaculales bacterium]
MIRVATYNVHGLVGRDGRRDPGRIAAVIRGLDCDAVGLQEVDSRGARTTLGELERRTGMEAVAGSTIVESDGEYGNALLTTARILDLDRHDLTVQGREPRGAIEARLETPTESAFTMIVTHLGLKRRERHLQVERLLEICGNERLRRPLVVAGDFNEWWPFGGLLGPLRSVLDPCPAVATFPAHRPVLALDRIWTALHGRRSRVRAVRTALTRVASDHLPLIADLEL